MKNVYFEVYGKFAHERLLSHFPTTFTHLDYQSKYLPIVYHVPAQEIIIFISFITILRGR